VHVDPVERLREDLQGFMAEIREQFQIVGERFRAIDRRLDAIDQRLDAMDQRLDRMDQRFDGLDRRLDAMDQRLDGLDRRLDAMDQRLDGLEARLGDVETGLHRHISEVSAADRRAFGVLAEALQTKIELVIEGVMLVDQKLDRHRVETRDELGKLDRRLTRVSARIHPRRRR